MGQHGHFLCPSDHEDQDDGGETEVPPGLGNVVAVAASGEQSMAISASLQIRSIGVSNNSPVLRFQGFSGRYYGVQQSLPLTPGSWADLPGSPFAGDGHDVVVTDTNALTVTPRRLYRIKETR